MIVDTYTAASKTAKAVIHTDGFKGRYMVEKFDGMNETTGNPIFVKRQWRINTIEEAREVANRWIEQRN